LIEFIKTNTIFAALSIRFGRKRTPQYKTHFYKNFNKKTMELALKEVLKNEIQPILKEMGFTKKANYFYKKKDGLIYALWVGIDREYTENGAYFTMQFGIYSEALEVMLGREVKAFPKGYDFILNENVLAHTTRQYDRYLLENTTDLADFGVKMLDDVLQALVFFNHTTTLKSVMNYCLEHNYLVHHEDLMRYLAIINDDKKMKKYLSKIKEKLYKISDNAHAFYVQKSLKLKAEYASSESNDSTASAN
jgi:hypothetical protein